MEKYEVISDKIYIGVSSTVGFLNEKQYLKRKSLIDGDHSKCYKEAKSGDETIKKFVPGLEFKVIIPFEFKTGEQFLSADSLPKNMAEKLLSDEEKKAADAAEKAEKEGSEIPEEIKKSAKNTSIKKSSANKK